MGEQPFAPTNRQLNNGFDNRFTRIANNRSRLLHERKGIKVR